MDKNLVLKDGKCTSCGRRPELHRTSAKKKNPQWERIRCKRTENNQK